MDEKGFAPFEIWSPNAYFPPSERRSNVHSCIPTEMIWCVFTHKADGYTLHKFWRRHLFLCAFPLCIQIGWRASSKMSIGISRDCPTTSYIDTPATRDSRRLRVYPSCPISHRYAISWNIIHESTWGCVAGLWYVQTQGTCEYTTLCLAAGARHLHT